MVKPIIKSHGLNLYTAEIGDVNQLLNSLSNENLREISELYHDSPARLLPELLNSDMSHVVKVDDKVIAFCGVRNGVMWTMFSKEIRYHWRSFVRASPALIGFYHNFYEILKCEVWEKNTFIHNWLVYLGFLPEFMETDESNNTVIHFVRCNFVESSIDSKTSRPVMH